jgi:hypothetical protein
MEVVMTKRQRGSDRFGRATIVSSGRSGGARREDRRLFWLAIAAGRSSEDATVKVGVSQPVGSRWFQENGDMAGDPAEYLEDNGMKHVRGAAKPFWLKESIKHQTIQNRRLNNQRQAA